MSGSLRGRLGIHTVKRSQGPVGYCLRGCGNRLDHYDNGRICILYVPDLPHPEHLVMGGMRPTGPPHAGPDAGARLRRGYLQ